MPSPACVPRLSVVVPTYNRAELLTYSLRALVEQTLAPDDFEVVVVDDGSSDRTREVIAEFQSKLNLSYLFLERNVEEVAQLGHCVSRVRNRGAELATAPILVFMDTGLVPGTEFLEAHLTAHAEADKRTQRVVLGYAYGTEKLIPFPDLDELLRTRTPEEVRSVIGDGPVGLDIRHFDFDRPADEVRTMAGGWAIAWSLNFSLPAALYRQVGGHDEGMRGWGIEDLEFAFRLGRAGEIVLSRAAWAIEWPTPVDMQADARTGHRNFLRFLTRYRHPDIEIWYDLRTHISLEAFQRDHTRLRAWTEVARPSAVVDELEAVERQVGVLPERVTVIGCGERIPEHWHSVTVLDFDVALLERAAAGTGHTALHGIGVMTGIADNAMDLVVVTSRLAGLWSRWGDAIMAEARRIGGDVRVPFLAHTEAG
jgi:validoxylamine A glucosyltransferase